MLYIAFFLKKTGDAAKMTEGTTSPSIDEGRGNSPTKSSLNISFSDSEDEIPDSVIEVALYITISEIQGFQMKSRARR